VSWAGLYARTLHNMTSGQPPLASMRQRRGMGAPPRWPMAPFGGFFDREVKPHKVRYRTLLFPILRKRWGKCCLFFASLIRSEQLLGEPAVEIAGILRNVYTRT
jgi:hypothetical protein